MLLLIPIGGLGTRFSKANYTKPKPLINVLGKPIIFWLLDNLNLKNISHIIIPYHSTLKPYRFEDLLKKTYPKITFIFNQLTENTEGASHTIKLALEKLVLEDQPILCLDSDNFYTTDIITLYERRENKNCVLVFKDDTQEPIYSYSKIDDNNRIIEIKEKDKISNLANTGGYGFNSWKELLSNINLIMENKIKQKDEYYTSTVIREMIRREDRFNVIEIEKDKFICLGTPLQVRLFCNNYPKYNINLSEKIETKRFCFDLDNTLVSFPVIAGDYTSCLPLDENIKLVRYLKKFGHTIIIHTARRMRTHNGNVGRVIGDIGKITLDQLERFNIPYDEIYFGKPQADFYIDDLGVSAFDNLEKELGFYQNNIDPRSFNSVESVSINLYRKKSKDLSGEIYYYNNIPCEIKDLFPLMIRYDEINSTWYDMEKINGIPISKLYLAEELTPKLLDIILKSLNRIHKVSRERDGINIYDNYNKKLLERKKMIDYSKFNKSEEIYESLKIYFNNYEREGKGKMSIIHGDTVMTNILVNQFGKIKLIDMRGQQGDKLSIMGDKYYDYGKLYQSLTGYEEVLGNKMVSIEYKNNLIKYFESKFSDEEIKIIKMIKKLLIFTLIPLHQEENRDKLWKLIF